MTSPVLAIDHLVVRYPGCDQPTLDGLTLSLSPGQRLALVGPSGCGKSTVARAVLQLLPPGSQCSGGLLLAGQEPGRLQRPALRQLRGEAVGLVFQDPMTRLNPLLTIGDHLGDTLAAHRPRWRRRQVRERAEELLTRVGINPERYGSYPHEFSGGMRQRLAIALAMALNPPLVIADEPTTSLDVAIAGQVMGELSALCSEAGSALLLISHDLALAGRWCDQIAVLDQGRLIEQAPAQQLLTAPASPLAQRLVAKARQREGAQSAMPAPAPALLELEELRSWHPLPSLPWQRRWLKAVDGVSLRLQRGETIGLVGASGCEHPLPSPDGVGTGAGRHGATRRPQPAGPARPGPTPGATGPADGFSRPPGLPQPPDGCGRSHRRSPADPRPGQPFPGPPPGPGTPLCRGADPS